MAPLIGIFGGTFDPVHLGHRNAVDALCKTLEFAQINWVLSARPPHKDQVNATVEQRFEMLKIALKDEPRYVADDIEIKRQAPSYTIDTVKAFQQRYTESRLCVIIGGDSLHSLHTWRQYDELMQTVNWVVMHRPGYSFKVPSELTSRLVESPAQLLEHASGKLWLYQASDYDVSSTQLRAKLTQKRGAQQTIVRNFLTEDVINYIQAQKIYMMGDSPVTKSIMNPEQIKDHVIDALEDVKGQDIKAINIADISDFADYMIVVSGSSDTHVKALARSASDKLRSQGVKPLNEDGADVGEWVLVDFGDVVLHVMRPEVRNYYDLEKLWDEDVRKLVEQARDERGD